MARSDQELAVCANVITAQVRVHVQKHDSKGGDSYANHDPIGLSKPMPTGI